VSDSNGSVPANDDGLTWDSPIPSCWKYNETRSRSHARNSNFQFSDSTLMGSALVRLEPAPPRGLHRWDQGATVDAQDLPGVDGGKDRLQSDRQIPAHAVAPAAGGLPSTQRLLQARLLGPRRDLHPLGRPLSRPGSGLRVREWSEPLPPSRSARGSALACRCRSGPRSPGGRRDSRTQWCAGRCGCSPR